MLAVLFLLLAASPIYAQQALAPVQDSVVQAVADEAELTPIPATALPKTGTFWVMTTGYNGNLTALPYPTLPARLSALPIYSVAGNIFMVDDTGGQLVPSSARRMNSLQAASTLQAQVQSVAGLIERIQMAGSDENNQSFQPNGFTSMIDTNGLWLEASNEVTNLGLRLHNTVGGDNYQLLSTPDLTRGYWDLGEILPGASDGYTDFSPVPMTNAAAFFWAHHANPVMSIWSSQYAVEPNPTNSDPGQPGIIYIENDGSATNDVTVYYSIGGTALNGIDYSNLTGEVVIPVSSYYAEIDIDPIADGLKPDQTIILTLLQNTNYLIDPSWFSATNTLYANPEVYPVANGDNVNVCPNNSKNISLQAQDPRGLPLTYSILTWPAHGTLNTNALPLVTYTNSNCYEGQDSFTFTASDGRFTSAPATVTLFIADPVYASSPTPQTCRGTPSASFSLGSDNCGETLSYALLSSPAHGTLSGTAANLTYTPTGTSFTGTDSFNYILYSECGDSATGTATVTVGDASLSANSQRVMTGTNRPVAITLSATSSGPCNADTSYYIYTVVSGTTNGTLSGTPPHVTYRPNTNYEGMDSFQFTVRDGVLTNSPATVTLYVVAGPMLMTECDPFGTAVRLNWNLDDVVRQMWPQGGLNITDFIVYRSAVSGGPYTPIATNFDTSQMSYLDTTAVPGQTNYYVVTFESQDYYTGATYKSPFSNEIEASGRNPDNLIPANAVWNVVTNLSHPTNVVKLQAPFSSVYPSQYPNLYPLPNTNWPAGTTWSNHIILYIPTNVVLSQVQYSIAIDNDYWLYLNNSTNYIDALTNHDGYATWSPLQSFTNVAPGLLRHGTNDIGVVIQDVGEIDYFSMIVTTNTCGW